MISEGLQEYLIQPEKISKKQLNKIDEFRKEMSENKFKIEDKLFDTINNKYYDYHYPQIKLELFRNSRFNSYKPEYGKIKKKISIQEPLFNVFQLYGKSGYNREEYVFSYKISRENIGFYQEEIPEYIFFETLKAYDMFDAFEIKDVISIFSHHNYSAIFISKEQKKFLKRLNRTDFSYEKKFKGMIPVEIKQYIGINQEKFTKFYMVEENRDDSEKKGAILDHQILMGVFNNKYYFIKEFKKQPIIKLPEDEKQ